jgi:transposase
MPAERLSMRKVYEVLRLKFGCGRSNREIAHSCSIGRSTVSDYLLRAKAAGISWPLPPELDEAALERLLFPSTDNPITGKDQPDWAEIHQELKGKNVTLAMLWQEYKERHPDGLQYSWFCQQYAKWRGKLDLVMRQSHRAGEKMFVDYAGQTVPVIDIATGEIQEAQVFVAVLGASSYAYAEATWSQRLPDWIGSHVRAISWFGGVTELLIPDNLKSGVDKPCLYEPDLNPTYQDLASHYGATVLPARVRKPKDKAKAESGVQVVERWILARLRHHRFFKLFDLNREIRQLLEILNNRPFQKLPGSRKSMYESLERPALLPLPATPYQFAEWKKAKVHIDYHLEVDGHYYSVPHSLVGKMLAIRFTQSTVECMFRGQRVASHRRSYQKGGHSTLAEHMPLNHRRYAEWSPERFLRWAGKIGPSTVQLAERIFASRRHPQQAYRSLLGILRLGKSYTDERLEAACRRALVIDAISYRSIESILKNNMENKPLPGETAAAPPASTCHRNIRGADYYHLQEGKPC